MKLARVNTLLFVAILLVNGYVVVLPFVPAWTFHAQQHSQKARTITERVVSKEPHQTAIAADAQELLIPAMVFDETIHDGNDMRTLRQGLWRIPYSSTPDKGSNTVIAAHRFTYTNPRGTFYHLDKLHVGDPIAILWHGKKYTYTVTKTEQVPPTATEVEAPSKDAQLTLYTCTPLWNPKDRLVVIAKLENIQ